MFLFTLSGYMGSQGLIILCLKDNMAYWVVLYNEILMRNLDNKIMTLPPPQVVRATWFPGAEQ